MSIVIIQCSDDGAGPESPDNGNTGTASRFSGITLTDINGNVLGGDTTDWCYSGGKSVDANFEEIPSQYALYPAYINPSNGPVRIDYDLPQSGNIHIYIIDTNETTIRTVFNSPQLAGSYSVIWDQSNDNGQFVSPGIYGCVIQAGNFNCFGDIQINSTPDHIIIYSISAPDTVFVTYKASTQVGGIVLTYDISGSVEEPIFMPVTWGMVRSFKVIDNSLAINILPDIPIAPMPSGAHQLLKIPINGSLWLRGCDASDATGSSVLRSTILNN